MTNIYWPVYKNIEREISRLTYAIHMDDTQLNVYSSLISDLILRASVEIESISKELYKTNGGLKSHKIKYDSDALEHLNALWKLDKKVVLVSAINCYQTNKSLIPFGKNEVSRFHGNVTFSWNNAYQSLKHDRANSLKLGSLKYLFEIMSALFVLNIYHEGESYFLEKDKTAMNFPINMGSDLFSIKLHRWIGYDGQHNYIKKPDFDECIYLTKYTEDSLEKNRKVTQEMFNKQIALFHRHPKFLEYRQNNNPFEYKGENLMLDVLGKDDYINIIREAGREHLKIVNEHEAILNKNHF